MQKAIKGAILYPFATLTLIALILAGVALALLLGVGIESKMRENATKVAAAAATSALQPHVAGYNFETPLLNSDYDRLQAAVTEAVLSASVSKVSIYNDEGVVVYSSSRSDLGRAAEDMSAVESALRKETVGATSGAAEGSEGGPPGGPILTVYTPLLSPEGELIGALQVQQDYSATAQNIREAKRDLYFALAGTLAILYVVIQLGAFGMTRALSKDHARLAYLYETGEHVRSSLDLQEVLTQIVRDATVMAQGQYGLVCLLEPDSGDLVARSSYDHEKGSVSLHHTKMDEWLFHRVVATGKTSVANQKTMRYGPIFGSDIRDMSIVCVPMTLRSKVNGVIAVLRRSANDGFGKAETKLLEELAGQAAMAVEQANLFAKVRAYADELELSYDTTLKALTAALDAKDAATEGHSERVANLTVAIARELQVDEEKLVDIERGALLHDVGKIGVPDAVLRKPRTLTKREWQAMQRHPLLAGLLVSKVGFLEGALPILLYHHERYDGRGYPFGLAGDRIPLEARIFAVVDAYDAMTSDRPYRKAISHEEAVQEIIANAGTQFDPAVVEVFRNVIERVPLVDEPEIERAAA